MRCLFCRRDDLSPTAETCPGCGVAPSMWLRDVLPPGFELHGGRYRLHHPLGKGGFGVTYLGEHLQLGAPVAIKEFFPQEQALRDSETRDLKVPTHGMDAFVRALARFLEEGRILARLRHPGVVRVSDLFEERGTAYLVMDLVEGGTLREELERAPEGRLEESRIRQLTGQLVEALHAVHRAGVCHLDIKPENVLLTKESQPVLVDFGSARYHFGTETRTRTSSPYTEAYAAPELFGGKPGEPATDLYELGVMMHEMLTGTLPPSAVRRLMDLEGGWRPAVETEPWRRLLESALSFRPEQRPQSVREWWEGATRSLTGRPTPSLPQRSAPRPYRTIMLRYAGEAPAAAAVGQTSGVAPPTTSPSSRPKASERPGESPLVVEAPDKDAEPRSQSEARKSEASSDPIASVPVFPPPGLWRAGRNAQGFEEFQNQDGSILILVPEGPFTMGSEDSGAFETEAPLHRLTLPSYLIGKTPITNEQFSLFVSETEYRVQGIWSKSGKGWSKEAPAVGVTWQDAQAYCRWAGLSLPTEAEWEKAARGEDARAYPWGQVPVPEAAWHDGNSQGRPHEVGQLPQGASPYGCLDMAGNVWEWCSSLHRPYPYREDDGREAPESHDFRVLRGGSYAHPTKDLRCALRARSAPNTALECFGFRPVLLSRARPGNQPVSRAEQRISASGTWRPAGNSARAANTPSIALPSPATLAIPCAAPASSTPPAAKSSDDGCCGCGCLMLFLLIMFAAA